MEAAIPLFCTLARACAEFHAEWLRGTGPTTPRQPDQLLIKTGRSVPIPARFAGDMDIRRVVGRFAVAPELTSLIPLNPDEAFCVYGRAGPSAAPEIRP